MAFLSNVESFDTLYHKLFVTNIPILSRCEEYPDLISLHYAFETRRKLSPCAPDISLFAFVDDVDFNHFLNALPDDHFSGNLKHRWDSSPKKPEQAKIKVLVESRFQDTRGVIFTHSTSTHFGSELVTVRKYTLYVPHLGTLNLLHVKTRDGSKKRSASPSYDEAPSKRPCRADSDDDSRPQSPATSVSPLLLPGQCVLEVGSTIQLHSITSSSPSPSVENSRIQPPAISTVSAVPQGISSDESTSTFTDGSIFSFDESSSAPGLSDESSSVSGFSDEEFLNSLWDFSDHE
eukprot:GILI01018016.1.p1 GENE.GILI01018016.1~~GILI01018016.1.p1  ORF type:complete len:291 (+),score=67.65 GILI01018016.1:111-983(+)